jgi:hypothetical protein
MRGYARNVSTSTSFVSLDEARDKIEQWRVEYNRERPHPCFGNLTPEEAVRIITDNLLPHFQKLTAISSRVYEKHIPRVEVQIDGQRRTEERHRKNEENR